ncbi:hypothetical protein CMUS01_06016 [Colletotrichum musicola]|uniref:DUF7924 domain-containing protein n=1 Tax=Colletotrichum musicola TaxID=2175873 RepID=A0A8H6KNM9_9PEZI|nr:hypothetical protein CMUS01_06016 [Colletotrichum musicola]
MTSNAARLPPVIITLDRDHSTDQKRTTSSTKLIRPQGHQGDGCNISGQQQPSPQRPENCGTERPANGGDDDDDDGDRDRDGQKQPRPSPDPITQRSTQSKSDGLGLIRFWAKERHWPQECFEPDMELILKRKRSQFQSDSATYTTASDQRPREQKSAPYRDARFEALLETKGSFMQESPLGITDTSKTLCVTLLEQHQAYPEHTLFRDDIFDSTCQNIRTRNEDRVIQDIARLIVPSAESLPKFSARNTNILIESVNEGWNNSIPLTKTRHQPDYSVGFKRAAFTESQLARLSPFIGDYLSGDHSFFMSTYYMFFPFLTCEVKCGGLLDIADRQNAHSTTLAARGVVELFGAVQRGEFITVV